MPTPPGGFKTESSAVGRMPSHRLKMATYGLARKPVCCALTEFVLFHGRRLPASDFPVSGFTLSWALTMAACGLALPEAWHIGRMGALLPTLLCQISLSPSYKTCRARSG